jgi:prevent-host-death family protein
MPSKEFRRRLGEVLAGDETVVITKRGKRAVIVIPLESEFGHEVQRLMNDFIFDRYAGCVTLEEATRFNDDIDDELYGPVSEEAEAEWQRRLAEGFVPPRLVAEERAPSAHAEANSGETRRGRRKAHKEAVTDAPPVL